MTSRASKIDEIVEKVMDLEPAERDAYLQNYGDDADIIAEVKAFLALMEKVEEDTQFLDPSSLNHLSDPFKCPEGIRIGPYKLQKEIGRGGMSRVFLAERVDGEFQQKVAIKVAHLPEDHERPSQFDREKTILAGLDHPNIARILDGGALFGFSYIVMEFIEGKTITEFSQNQNLNLQIRLELFQRVCQAIQHAHQNLVIHRDIKPQNILVNDHGVKVLDFGIAKLLDTKADDETQNLGLLTPRYASPEQVQRKAITTASDVYQLGLLLYELVCQQPAHALDGEVKANLYRTVCELEPKRPRAILGKKVPKDLEQIILMALRKEPQHRYASPSQLAEDIDRFLHHEPVMACAASFGYRLSKLLSRYKVGVTFVCFLMFALAGYVYLIQENARKIESERNLAREEARKVADVKQFLSNMLWDFAGNAQSDAERQLVFKMVQRNESYIQDSLKDHGPIRAEIYGILGRIYRIQGYYDHAIQCFAKVQPLLEQDLGKTHPESIENLRLMGRTKHFHGLYQEAEKDLRHVLELRKISFGPGSFPVAESLNNLGSLLHAMGRYQEAEPLLEEALTICRVQNPGGLYYGFVLLNAADLYTSTGRFEKALPTYRESISVVKSHLPDSDFRVSMSLDGLGHLLVQMGELDEAKVILGEAYAQRIQIVGSSHPIVAESLKNFAHLAMARGDFSLAILNAERALKMYQDFISPHHLFVIRTQVELGEYYLADQQLGRANQTFKCALQGLEIQNLTEHPLGQRALKGMSLAHLDH